MDPKTLKVWLFAAALAYLILPFDFLPDFLGLPGRIDDILMMALLAWYYRGHAQQFAARARETGAGSSDHSTNSSSTGRGRSAEAASSGTFDAYAVLGVEPSASGDAIKTAYRSRMREYHPDKVAHLGEELQQLAHDKSQQIERAYRQLRR